jgi:cytochrome c oxidase subunit II
MMLIWPGIQSALDPAGPQADRIYGLWSLFFWILTAVYVITIAFFFAAVIRARRNAEPQTASEHGMTVAVSVGAALTIVILIALLTVSVSAGHAIGTLGQYGTAKLEVDVTGHQWWWEVSYPDPESDKMIRTANEIHIPVGAPVLFRLATRDVIHSLWIPNLHGKRDLIPGRVNKFWIEADKPGVYRSQCAEYCGMQHAHMSLVVIAEPMEQFRRWQEHMRTPAPDPQTAAQARGQQTFLSMPCVNCHAITGVDAYATLGPDLTHIASRPTLAAGTLINNHGNLQGWILNSQAIKPGNMMPPNVMTAEQANDVVAYLESLK